MIDDTDRSILTILQRDARTSNAEVARRVGLTPSAIFERIRKLEQNGIVRGYGARIDPNAVDLGLLAFLFVRTDELPSEQSTAVVLERLPQVQEVHHVAGEDCFLIKVRCADTEELGRFIREAIGSIPTVRSTRTTVVLETVKEAWSLPLADEEGDDDDEGEDRGQAG